ncbi:hypothetical protein MMC30_001690 [Trapelia coarctata]|nr:hypothetical protein [Trapelia coarctata]
MRSPKARAAERARKHPLQTPSPRPPPSQAPPPEASPSSKVQLSTWPVENLAAAHNTGSLPLPPNEAIPFLEKFSGLMASKSVTKHAVEHLCQEYSTPPGTLFFLAKCLLDTNDAAYFPILRELLITGSSLGNEESTKLLIAQALDTHNLQSLKLAGARMHLAKLVELEDPTAMMLQAATYAREGQDEKAMKLCEKVIKMEPDRYAEMLGFDYARARCFDTLALLKRKNKDSEGSKQALERAVLEHDECVAYLELAMYHKPYGSPEYLQFLMKAAASGALDAASALGGYYLAQAWEVQQKGGEDDTTVSRSRLPYSGPKYSLKELYRLSEEWLAVAVDDPGHDHLFTSRSQVDLAILLRKRGEYEKGSVLLGKGMQSGDYGRCVGPWVMERWRGKDDWSTMMTGVWKIWDDNKDTLPKR